MLDSITLDTNWIQIHIAFDTRVTASKGFAYVQYADADAAVDAYQQLDGKHFQGRLLHILPATAKKTYKIDDYELSKLPLKKQKEIKRKQNASSSSFSWNSLYMNVSLIPINSFEDQSSYNLRPMLSCHLWLEDSECPSPTCSTPHLQTQL